MKKLFVFLFLTGVLFSGCSNEKIDSITSSQKEILSFLPAETEFVLYMNLKELRKTEFWSDYFKPSLTKDTSNNWLTDFEQKTGTGLQKGISEIVTATTWDGNDAFAVKFDRSYEKVKDYFRNELKFSSAEISGKPVYSLRNGSDAKFYFPKDDLLMIIKDENYLKGLINGNAETFNKKNPVYGVIEKIKNKQHYWMATNRGGFAAGLLNLMAGNKEIPVKKIITSVKEISLSAEFSDGVNIQSVWGCSQVKDAYLLSTGVRSALAMNLLAGKDYQLSQLLKKLEIDRNEKDVYFEININKDELAGLKKLAERKKLTQQL